LKQKLERQSRIELKQSESQITMKVQDMVEELADTSQLQLSVEELKSKLMRFEQNSSRGEKDIK
jgi:hypothetical protein